MTMHDCGGDLACECVKANGACSIAQRNALLDAKIVSARYFLKREQDRGNAVTDGRPLILKDLLKPDEWARVLEVAGTIVTDEITTDADDPLAAAQAASDARYGKVPFVPTTERAKAFVEGIDPDDHYAALERKYAGAK